MNETPYLHPALLPAGFRDVLPPEAELEARSIEAIMDCFSAYGYQRVEPPLLEFEENLLAGSGAATAEQTFRFLDPESHRMMGLRADTTPQIARLAATRLADLPRPLRLAYAGQCLRVCGSQLQPERQISQAGIELIGHDAAEADAEIILTAVAALAKIGLTQVSVDLTAPRLVLSLLNKLPVDAQSSLARALDRKDAVSIRAHGAEMSDVLLQLLNATGPAERVIPALLEIVLEDDACVQARRLAETVAAIRRHRPNLPLTVDPVEFRGYQYHTGICMTFFALGEQAELGRGGRYLCGDFETATGITLYPDTIVRAAPPAMLRPRVFLPFGTSSQDAETCRGQNFATVAGLEPHAQPAHEALRLNCDFIFQRGTITPLSKDL